MGADFYSYLIVGCEISKEKLYIEKPIRSCDCKVEESNEIIYCPKCGTKFWRTYKEPIIGFEDEDRFLGLQIIYNTDCDRCWIAIESHRIDFKKECSKLDKPFDVHVLKHELKLKLEPNGLWNEDNFGVWNIGHVDY